MDATTSCRRTALAARAALAGLAGLAVALAAPAAAAPPPPRAALAPPAPRPDRPAAAPAPVAAPAVAADGTLPPAWRAGVALGLEWGLGDLDYTAPKIRLEVQRDLRRLGPATTLSFAGALSFAHASGSEDVVVLADPFLRWFVTAPVEWDANILELVPSARVVHAASPKLSLFADGGLGLVHTSGRATVPAVVAAGGGSYGSSTGLGGVIRIAGGLLFAPRPDVRVAVQLIGLHLRFADGPGAGFEAVASVSHRL